MSSKSCVLLALLVALLVPGESHDEELKKDTYSAVSTISGAVQAPAASSHFSGLGSGCLEGLRVPTNRNLTAGSLCLSDMVSFEEMVDEFRRIQAVKREQRRLRRERERRERIAKRRAERRKDLIKCAKYVASEYATKSQARLLLKAPLAVLEVVCAANEIDDNPYFYGGGHAGFSTEGDEENGGPGLDCSGAVSYALHGGGFLESPLNSRGLEGWGKPGPGKWITVYTNPAHAWMVVAGVRFDTREPPSGETGPRWHSSGSSTDEFIARHPEHY